MPPPYAPYTGTRDPGGAHFDAWTALHGDPHITFAHGGQADFRGSHRAYYAFVSSPGYQFAPHFQEVDFWYHVVVGVKQLVHGTFMTKAAWHVRTSRGRHLFIKADAMEKGVASYVDLSGKGSFITLKPGQNVRIDDVNISTNMLTIRVDTPDWSTNVTSKPIYGLVQPLMNETHVHGHWALDQRRFDVQIQGVYPQPYAHGIVGQSYHEGIAKVDGKMDEYAVEMATAGADSDGMLPTLTTSAQAEGAIEGVFTDYLMPTLASTEFKFSRYTKPSAPSASREGGIGQRSASASDWGGTPGSLARPKAKKEL